MFPCNDTLSKFMKEAFEKGIQKREEPFWSSFPLYREAMGRRLGSLKIQSRADASHNLRHRAR